MKRLATIAFVLMLLLFLASTIVTGCGATNVSTINADQFRVLQKARNEIGTMIHEVSEAANPSLPLAQRLEKVTAVLKKHQKAMPDPTTLPRPSSPHYKAAKAKWLKTLEGQLEELSGAASGVAGMYERSLQDLYGIKEFEKYLLEHTTDEGSKINTANPPPNMGPGETQNFMWDNKVNIAYDPATGAIRYILGEHPPDYRLSEASVPHIESQFILDAQYWMNGGNRSLLEDTRI